MDTKLCLFLILSAHVLTGKILYLSTTSFLISPVVFMLFTIFLNFHPCIIIRYLSVTHIPCLFLNRFFSIHYEKRTDYINVKILQ